MAQQSTDRYNKGTGANVTQAYKQSEYVSWLRNAYDTDYFDNLALQQTIYEAIVNTLGAVSPATPQQITWNYNINPSLPTWYQALQAPEDITWGSDGSLVVNNDWRWDTNHILKTSDAPTTSDPAKGMLASTPLKEGKFYFEVEILEDTSYYFMIAPVGWSSSNIVETGSGSIAAIGAEYWQFLTGRGTISGLKWDENSNRNDVQGLPYFPTRPKATYDVYGDGSVLTWKRQEPFRAGDILSFTYDTDNGVAYLGMDGSNMRWPTIDDPDVFTISDPSDVNSGIKIGGVNPAEQNKFALYAVPFEPHPADTDPAERFLLYSNPEVTCNVRVLTGSNCNYSAPTGFEAH